jgi:hypothetical protein
MIFVALLFVFGNVGTARATDPDCSSGQIHGIYYMSCFARNTGESDDTGRIGRALGSGNRKLIFNEGDYYVSSVINLPGNLVLEGTSTGTSSRVNLTSSSTALFKIGPGVNGVTIRDINLTASSQSSTIAILGEGGSTNNCTTNDIGNCSSLHHEFKNIAFTGFGVGIKANALNTGINAGLWQFDNVKLDHSSFENCLTGVYINSNNSGWQISGLEFFSPANAYGIYIERGAYITIDSLIGNGTFSGTTPQSEALIFMLRHGTTTIRNIISEGFEYDLKVEGVSLTAPIFLMNSILQDKVDIEGATVVSTANQFGIQYEGTDPTPMPVASEGAQITSIGDKFCTEGFSFCNSADAKWDIDTDTDAVLLFSTGQKQNTTAVPSYLTSFMNIESDLENEATTKPLLSIIAPTWDRDLLRLGQANNYYTLSRNVNNGWMRFRGNQAAPYKGYDFDGPVKLPSYTASTLPTVLETGSLTYCSNCQAGTSPCATGTGGGALALSVGSSWVCK